MTAPDPVRAARALGGAAAGILVLEGIAVAVRAARHRAERRAGLTGASARPSCWSWPLVLILAAGVQRRPQGVYIGTALQVPLLLTGLLNSVMWFVGGAFVLIWLYLLQVRKDLLGSPVRGPTAPVRTRRGGPPTP